MKALLLALALLFQAPPPSTLHFQARLSDAAGTPLAGPVTVTVRIYDVPIGGTAMWAETQAVTALSGIVNLALGTSTAIPPAPAPAPPPYFAVQVNADPEMLPRREIVSVPFARRAASSAGLDANAVLPPNIVSSAQIADGAITGNDLATNAVNSLKIADGSVGTADLANGAVTELKLSTGCVGSFAIQTAAVTNAHLANAVVTSAKLASGAVGTDQLATGAVIWSKISDGAITAAKLGADSVTSNAIASGAVGAAEIAYPLAVTSVTPALRIEQSSAGGDGLQSFITSVAGTSAALFGQTAAGAGTGVWGSATSTAGIGFGVAGVSTSGYGVYGYTPNGSVAVIGSNL